MFLNCLNQTGVFTTKSNIKYSPLIFTKIDWYCLSSTVHWLYLSLTSTGLYDTFLLTSTIHELFYVEQRLFPDQFQWHMLHCIKNLLFLPFSLSTMANHQVARVSFLRHYLIIYSLTVSKYKWKIIEWNENHWNIHPSYLKKKIK